MTRDEVVEELEQFIRVYAGMRNLDPERVYTCDSHTLGTGKIRTSTLRRAVELLKEEQ